MSANSAPTLFENHRYYTAAEAAEGLRLAIKTIRNWIYAGALPVAKIGGRRIGILGRDLNAKIVQGIYSGGGDDGGQD